MGKSRTLPDYPRGLTFEDVWAALMETRERQERDAREWNEWFEKDAREWRERHERDAREWEKVKKDLAKQMKETDKKIGDLGDRFGEMIEHMVMPALVKKFRELGFVFTKAYPEAEYKDVANNIITEVDITLENGDKVMLVEVKSKPSTDDITGHIERMEIVRTRARLRTVSM